MNNQEIISKADMALADLATAGSLNPEQAAQFVRKLRTSPTMLRSARMVGMKSTTKKINKIGFGSRILRPGVSGTALSSGDRVKPGLEQVVLETDEVIAEVNLPYDVLEDNIEGGSVGGALQQAPGGLHQTIVDLIAERAAIDLEELGLLGDTASGDSYLAMTDGWLKRANSNVVAAGGVPISKDVLKAAVKAMPDQYLRNRAEIKHWVSVDNETELRDTYANRNTALGDAMLQGTSPLYMHSSEVLSASAMPSTDVLYTNPLNLIFGIWRNIQIEYDKDIRTRTFIIVLTARVGFQIEETEAVVRTTGVTP